MESLHYAHLRYVVSKKLCGFRFTRLAAKKNTNRHVMATVKPTNCYGLLVQTKTSFWLCLAHQVSNLDPNRHFILFDVSVGCLHHSQVTLSWFSTARKRSGAQRWDGSRLHTRTNETVSRDVSWCEHTNCGSMIIGRRLQKQNVWSLCRPRRSHEVHQRGRARPTDQAHFGLLFRLIPMANPLLHWGSILPTLALDQFLVPRAKRWHSIRKVLPL
jgi:hypothetical protein